MTRDALTPEERAFVHAARVGHLATTDGAGEPSVMPVCYAFDGARFYTPIDEKPKRHDRPLRRVRNIEQTGRAALVVDRYDADWTRLGWVHVRGRAEIIAPGEPGHQRAIELLRARYPQYRTMTLERAPVIALTPEHVRSWGRLTPS